MLVTPEHPVFVRGRGWTAAGEVVAGDELATLAGEWRAVESNRSTGETATVYNLRVADWHTYFVGDDHWPFALWVHNAGANYLEGRGTRPWTGSVSSRPWRGKFGDFRYGSARSGHGISTSLAQDGTLHINYVAASNLTQVARRGLNGSGLLDLAIAYHGRDNIRRITAEFIGYATPSPSMYRDGRLLDLTKNWRFFNDHRAKLGDAGAILKTTLGYHLRTTYGFTRVTDIVVALDRVKCALRAIAPQLTFRTRLWRGSRRPRRR